MIGSGIFLLPASLAAFGGISLLGWLGSSIGAIILALLFSKLSKIISNATGGPYAYTKAGFGDFAAFLVAWGYWVSVLCTNAAIAVTFVSYMTVFFPIIATNSILSIITGLSAVWFLTWINTLGVKEGGRVQVITTILKISPLIMIALVGMFYIDVGNFIPFNISGKSDLMAITATVTLTFFAFQGVESATIPAGNIHEPEKTIPRATMIGTYITIVIYVLCSTVVMGMIPSKELQFSNAPLADAAMLIFGEQARYWVAFGAIASTFGALNGYILLQGQMPLAAAKDKLFPALFRKENKVGSPAVGIIFSSVLISLLMLMNFTKGLTDTFTFLVLLTTVLIIVPYLFSAASFAIIVLQKKTGSNRTTAQVLLALLGFLFSMWGLIGSGEEAVFYGFIALLSGIPFYVWMKRN